MKRRNFLKLCCAAVVAPSLPVSNICCTGYTETTWNELLQLVRERRDAARQAIIDDLEEWLFAVGDIAVNVDSGDELLYDWSSLEVSIYYKQ